MTRRGIGLGRLLRNPLLFGAVSLGSACGGSPNVEQAPLGKHAAALSGSLLWEKKTGSPMPPARMGHGLVYDPVRHVTTAMGGRPVNDTGNSLSDTWTWDGQAWTSESATLPRRGFISGAFDTSRQVTVLFGGLDKSSGQPTTYFSETFERGTGNWTQRASTPSARSTSTLAYDAGRGVTVLFGGFDGKALDDIWEWDGNTWTRRCTAAPCSTGPRPPRRVSPVLVYDAARAVTLLFGGWADNLTLGDTWTWDGAAWTAHQPVTSPSPRNAAAAAYDPATQRVYVFGGATAGAEVNDLWSWDGASWEELASTTPPAARRDVRLAWDTARRRGVLFGGRANNQAVDFWELSLVGNSCSSDDDCHNGTCGGGVCGGGPGDAGDAAQSGGSGGATGTPGAGGSDSSDAAGTPNLGLDSGASFASAGETAAPVPGADTSPGGAPRRDSLYACSTAPARQRFPGAGVGLGCLALCGTLRRRVRPS